MENFVKLKRTLITLSLLFAVNAACAENDTAVIQPFIPDLAVPVFYNHTHSTHPIPTPKGIYFGVYGTLGKTRGDISADESEPFPPPPIPSDKLRENLNGFILSLGRNFVTKNPFTPNRFEIEYGTRRFDFTRAPLFSGALPQNLRVRAHQHTVLLNIYDDITLNTLFTPYIGLGGGAVITNFKSDATCPSGLCPPATESKITSTLGYVVRAGLRMRLSEYLDMDLRYEYAQMDDFRVPLISSVGEQTVKTNKIPSNSFQIGLMWYLFDQYNLAS